MVGRFSVDTSVIINGRILELIKSNELEGYENPPLTDSLSNKVVIILSKVVLAEVENQANQERTMGLKGLEVLEELYILAEKGQIELEIVGNRPTREEILLNPGGECDALIRASALEAKSTLITSDHVQSVLALVEGLDVIYKHMEYEDQGRHVKGFETLAGYFDDKTMSVHLIEGCVPLVKRGKPGEWALVPYAKGLEALDRKTLNLIAADLIEEAKISETSFIEKEHQGVTVLQLGNYRIVVCRPPFASQVEITAVKPLVHLTLDDYKLHPRMLDRLEQAEGVLVAGSPGAGKSTFLSALTEFYNDKNKIVKTLETVRDLTVPKEVTQLTALEGDLENTSDILLLIRPDFTVFDEVRTSADFRIFADMRLAGVGLIGVVHASLPVDAIQRFIHRVELGVIPSIVDTVIFIENGQVGDILSLKLTVKKPTGFQDKDLARPVVEVRNFLTEDLLYEIYNFGNDTIVAPVEENRIYGGSQKSSQFSPSRIKKSALAMDFEMPSDAIYFKIKKAGSQYILAADRRFGNEYMDVFCGSDYLFSSASSKNGKIVVSGKSSHYSKLKSALKTNLPIFGLLR